MTGAGMGDGINHLFASVAKWAMSLGATRIDRLPGCWEHDFTFDGLPMRVAINGSRDERPASWGGAPLPPFTALMMINGWPAVMVGPGGGTMMGGEPGTEDKLITAFEAATEAPTNV